MRAYAEDLRRRVVGALDREMTRREASEVFGVSVRTIKRWLKQRGETGGLTPKPIPGPVAVKQQALMDALPARLSEQGDATLEAQCSWWHGVAGVEVSTATMSRAIAALDWTRKKRR